MDDFRLTARMSRPSDLGPAEITAWERLSAALPLSSPFLSLHYARAVADTGMDARICVIYRDDKVCGFFPYQYRHRLARIMRTAEPIGAEMTDYVGVIASPDLRVSPRRLLQLAQLNHFMFSHLDESQLAHGLNGEQPRTGLRIRIPEGQERPLEAMLSARQKYLKDTERRARQLAGELGQIEFTLDVQRGRQQALEHLIGQKRAQYRRTKVTDPLKEIWRQRLLHRLCESQFDSCRGILSTISAGDQWIATHFGLIGHGILQYWLPVYNPDYARYAPGRLLIHHIIAASSTTAIHTIDRGEGDTPSKRELANEEHFLYRGVWHNNSVSSNIARGIHSLKWRLNV